MRCVAR